jgi:hypothetical protein
MKRLRNAIGSATLALVAGCATFPPPTQRLADAEAARRSAQEVGATNQSAARLHAQLAEEQIAKARALMQEEQNRAADLVLMRAQADAELALALAREQNAKADLGMAIERANATQTMTGNAGAKP